MSEEMGRDFSSKVRMALLFFVIYVGMHEIYVWLSPWAREFGTRVESRLFDFFVVFLSLTYLIGHQFKESWDHSVFVRVMLSFIFSPSLYILSYSWFYGAVYKPIQSDNANMELLRSPIEGTHPFLLFVWLALTIGFTVYCIFGFNPLVYRFKKDSSFSENVIHKANIFKKKEA